jgi:NitT/TauT family transport system substrate-binding protein
MIRTVRFICLATLVLSFLVREGLAQPVGEKIVISYPSVTSTGGVVPWIAKERGFFAKNGLDAELVYTSGTLSMQALLGGSVDLAVGNVIDPLRAIAGGADILVIASFNNSAPYIMAARPEVRDIKDLKGRKVGVRSLTGPATAMTQLILEEEGLDPQRDVQILRVGGTAIRLAALKDGHIDAALIDEAVAHRAKESGLNVISLKGVPLIHSGVYVRRNILQQKGAVIAAAVRAMRDAAVYMRANKPGSVQVIQRLMKVDDKQVAETSYEVLKESLVTDPRIPIEAIRQSLKLVERTDPRVKNIDVNRVFDLKLATALSESGK